MGKAVAMRSAWQAVALPLLWQRAVGSSREHL
jgi:hypothetical protein